MAQKQRTERSKQARRKAIELAALSAASAVVPAAAEVVTQKVEAPPVAQEGRRAVVPEPARQEYVKPRPLKSIGELLKSILGVKKAYAAREQGGGGGLERQRTVLNFRDGRVVAYPRQNANGTVTYFDQMGNVVAIQTTQRALLQVDFSVVPIITSNTDLKAVYYGYLSIQTGQDFSTTLTLYDSEGNVILRTDTKGQVFDATGKLIISPPNGGVPDIFLGVGLREAMVNTMMSSPAAYVDPSEILEAIAGGDLKINTGTTQTPVSVQENVGLILPDGRVITGSRQKNRNGTETWFDASGRVVAIARGGSVISIETTIIQLGDRFYQGYLQQNPDGSFNVYDKNGVVFLRKDARGNFYDQSGKLVLRPGEDTVNVARVTQYAGQAGVISVETAAQAPKNIPALPPQPGWQYTTPAQKQQMNPGASYMPTQYWDLAQNRWVQLGRGELPPGWSSPAQLEAAPMAPEPAVNVAELQQELAASQASQAERAQEVGQALEQAAQFGITIENNENLRQAYEGWQAAEAQVDKDQQNVQEEIGGTTGETSTETGSETAEASSETPAEGGGSSEGGGESGGQGGELME